MMESTPSRDNRDIIIDATLFSENLAEVMNSKAKVFGFILFKNTFAKIVTKNCTANSLINTHIIIWIGIYKHACTNVW